ncbi:hypothetical protein B0B39_03920 [Legionella longbeachae]|uniref:hypothetical protein n=1 Tax=Legionella longbeachae TaxID=450 RepID=UPI000A1C08DD|nr:hypothetical protein [Legionella longbeachae]ARM32715.1 hypothetical protein B0B39_03920 [Legionella longbeachae]
MPETEEQRKAREKMEREAAEQTRATELAQQKQAKPGEEESTRVLELDDDKGPEQEESFALKIYKEWLKKYKENNPDFKENENKIVRDPDGTNLLCFKDPLAEEDFVRQLAKNAPGGKIFDKGIPIASFDNGELIDLRTKKPFPEGDYAHLVSQLDSGVAYDKTTIKSPDVSAMMSPPSPSHSMTVSKTSLPEIPSTKLSEKEKESDLTQNESDQVKLTN